MVRLGISTAGTADKPILALVTVVVALAVGAGVGVAARQRRIVGDGAFVAFGLLGVVSAAGLPAVSLAGASVATVIAVATGTGTLRLLLAAEARDDRPAALGTDAPTVRLPGTTSRRHFLVAGSVATFGVAVVFAGARGLRRGAQAVGQRAAIRFPRPAEPAPTPAAVATGEELAVGKLSPLITPTPDFYRIDEALMVPSVNLDTWRLRITGMVDAPYELSFDELLAMPLIERDITLSCVSNEVGGSLVGNARWLGVRLADILGRARVQPSGTQIVGRSVDHFTVGFPTAVALDGRDAMVAVAQNGEPLTPPHGFPARLVVPGLYGYVSATKWLREIQLTAAEDFDAYWVKRGWAKQAPVKVESRIDVPGDYSQVGPGAHVVAGVAWAPNRGIERVEVRVDDGAWREAKLGRSLGKDSWRQWKADWDAPPGNHTLEVRATTTDGEVQSAVKRSPFPDGATGLHKINVRVDRQR